MNATSFPSGDTAISRTPFCNTWRISSRSILVGKDVDGDFLRLFAGDERVDFSVVAIAECAVVGHGQEAYGIDGCVWVSWVDEALPNWRLKTLNVPFFFTQVVE